MGVFLFQGTPFLDGLKGNPKEAPLFLGVRRRRTFGVAWSRAAELHVGCEPGLNSRRVGVHPEAAEVPDPRRQAPDQP